MSTLHHTNTRGRFCSRPFATLLFLALVLVPTVRSGAQERVEPFSVSSTVVVSQVYGGGGNSGATWKNDFIELFNLGSTTVSLTGWSVQYASSSGSSWQVTALSGSIAPGQYYLVREAAGAGGTTDLPTPDATGSIAMSATAGKVALVSSTTALSGTCPTTGTIVDLVGYGSANCFEGADGTATTSNTTAAIRNNNGCTDTSDNAADFTVTTPNPRNTASATNPCSGGGGPFITNSTPLPPATMGVEYAVTFGAAGGSGTGYTFLLTAGTLPPGLDLTDGVLEGEPETVVGSPFSFTIQVTDSAMATASKVFQLAVHNPDTCPVQGPAPRGCGVERWSVKTGSDPDAALVNLSSATPTTIGALHSFAYPSPNPPSNGRVAPAETTQWIIHATLTKYKLEDDSDYHLVAQDGVGTTMVTESVFPGDSPACVSTSSPFLMGMAVARCEMDSALPLSTGSFQTANVPVRITGVGMFDFFHGQTGASPNQIELHPILDITFLKTENATTSAGTNVTVHPGESYLTFPSVSAAGTTTTNPLEPSSLAASPSGYSLVGPALDLTSTATTSGATALCIAMPYVTDAAAFAKVKVLHLESGALVDRTSSRNPDAKLACGSLPTLGKIVVALASNPGTIAVSSGDNQTVPVGSAYQPLQVLVTNGATPLSGVSVTFSAAPNALGASGSFASSTPVMTNANGIATASAFTANTTSGSFNVTASAQGMAGLATFSLTSTPIAAPTSVSATAASSSSVGISWIGSNGATSYEVIRVGASGTSVIGTTAGTAITDATASPNTAYLYKVRAIAPAASEYSTPDLATTIVFTDAPLAGVQVKAVHFSELRTGVNAVRTLAGLGAATFTDSVLGGTRVKAVHLTELRAAVDAARTTLTLAPLVYDRPNITPGTSTILARDVDELRGGIR